MWTTSSKVRAKQSSREEKCADDRKSRCVCEVDAMKSWCAGEVGAETFVDWGIEEGGVMDSDEGRGWEGVSHKVME